MSTNPLINTEALDCLKNIVDCSRCTFCDRPEGKRGRYSCGHAACDECLKVAEVCLLCITPIDSVVDPKYDAPLTQRVENVQKLLSTFQDTFKIDVYKRQRISDQLKLEKEVFPSCIQAPMKYCNKRKSLTPRKKDKDKENVNPLLYLREQSRPSKEIKMENINQWLDRNEILRPPLSDLKVNLNRSEVIKYQCKYKNIETNKNNNVKKVSKRKSTSLLDKQERKKKSYKKTKINHPENIAFASKKLLEKNVNDESGIVLDDDLKIICIEDSQSEVIDKDKLALLAVAEAAREESGLSIDTFDCTQITDSQECEVPQIKKTLGNVIKKVPFYKKASLSQSCLFCKERKNKQSTTDMENPKNVSISIENQDYLTIINVTKCADTQKYKRSQMVQTDISHIQNEKAVSGYISDDLFDFDNQKDENGRQLEVQVKKDIDLSPVRKNVFVIGDSDTDTSCEEEKVLQVTAEVHRSCDPLDYGILSQLNVEEIVCRKRINGRGITPDSSNSSEKENFDPNKRKKRKIVKKNKSKKK